MTAEARAALLAEARTWLAEERGQERDRNEDFYRVEDLLEALDADTATLARLRRIEAAAREAHSLLLQAQYSSRYGEIVARGRMALTALDAALAAPGTET